MPGDPIGVGIIGTGWGLRALLPAFERTGRARVVALAGSSRARAHAAAGSHAIRLVTGDHRDVCEANEVDLVVVASPDDCHLEHASTALALGKHVYIEKPVGLDAGEARQIDRLASEHDRVVVVGHSLRFDPCVRAIRDLLRAGTIGRPYHASIVQCGSALTRSRPEGGGGVRLGMGSHMLDVLRFILGADALAVTAASGRDGAYFSALVAYPEVTAHLVTTAAAHVRPRFDVVLHGEEGDLTLSIDRTLLLHRVEREPEIPPHEQALPERGSAVFDVAVTYLAEAVVDAILNQRTSVTDAATPADGVRCLEELDASLASIRSGSTMRLA